VDRVFELKFHLRNYLNLKTEIAVTTVDSVKPPGYIYVAGNCAPVSCWTCKYGERAINFVLKIIGFVQQEVPRTRT